MKRFPLLVFLLVAGTAWGQTGGRWETVVSSGPRRAAAGDGLVCGSGVDFDVGEIFRRGFQMAFAPRVFRKNWPLYGYAIPNHQADDSCDLLDERYPDLTVGKAALVLSKPYAAAPGLDSFDYIGFPVESVAAVVGSGALAARAGNSAVQSSPEHAQFRIREVCRWLREPSLFTQPMLKIDALPYDLPGGVWANVELDGNAPSFEPLTLMAGVIGEPDGAGAAPILTWEEETVESGRRIVWAPVSGDEDLPAGPAVEEGGMWWKYTPAGRPESRGDYYLSWGGSESDVPFADTTWSSPSGAMQWMRMPVGEGAAHSRFTMWYAPRQNPENGGMAAAHTDGDWYLLTEEPLPRLAADIRFQYHCTVHTR